MRWSERQLAMLREMGIRVWAPRGAGDDGRAGERDARRRAHRPSRRSAPRRRRCARAGGGRRRAADRPAPVRVAGAAPRRARRAGARWPAPTGWSSASRSHRPRPIRPPPPSRSCCSTTCCARSGSRAAARGRERPRPAHLAVEEARRRARHRLPRSPRCAPRCILALGRAAAAALLGVDEPLGKLRGRVHERAGIPVVVTFALPYLLRHPADKPRAWADLCLAVAAIA